MDLETLSRANMLVDQIENEKKRCSEYFRQHERCKEYLESSMHSYGKKDYLYFEDVVACMVLPNRGNGEHRFDLRGDDPDVKCFYRHMFMEMKDVFEKKMNKSQTKLKQLNSELDAL